MAHPAKRGAGRKSPTHCGLLIRRPQVRTLLGPPDQLPKKTDYTAQRLALGMTPAQAAEASARARRLGARVARGEVSLATALALSDACTLATVVAA